MLTRARSISTFQSSLLRFLRLALLQVDVFENELMDKVSKQQRSKMNRVQVVSCPFCGESLYAVY
jgi:4-hydroxy-3-methylbut-2-en-1-yl diphosphate synthase IspG/GcpE